MTTLTKQNLSIVNCVAKDSRGKKPLRNIHLDYRKCKIVATDGYILSTAPIDVPEDYDSLKERKSDYISPKSVKILNLKANPLGDIELNGEVETSDQTYPDWERIVRDSSKCQPLIILSVPVLEKLLKMAKAQKVESLSLSAKGYEGEVINDVITTKIGEIETVFMPYVKGK